MESLKKDIYKKLYDSYIKANVGMKGQTIQEITNRYWKSVKNLENWLELCNKKINELEIKASQSRAKLDSFWKKVSHKKVNEKHDSEREVLICVIEAEGDDVGDDAVDEVNVIYLTYSSKQNVY